MHEGVQRALSSPLSPSYNGSASPPARANSAGTQSPCSTTCVSPAVPCRAIRVQALFLDLHSCATATLLCMLGGAAKDALPFAPMGSRESL